MRTRTNSVTRRTFENDVFGRKEFGQRLFRLLQSHGKTGLVITLDGAWGVGKTYFMDQWTNWTNETLNSANPGRKEKKQNLIRIDAFSAEPYGDPVQIVGSEIVAFGQTLDLFPREEAKEFLVKLAKATQKSAIGAVGGAILGEVISRIPYVGNDTVDDDQSEGDASTDGRGNAGRPAEKAFADLDIGSVKNQIDDVKKKLEDVVVEFQKNRDFPLVLVIDELDRCRPNFTVQLIESIKHFFDVENVVFLLVVQKQQLHEAFISVYGNIDAKKYLQKFVHIDLSLPTNHGRQGRKDFRTIGDTMMRELEFHNQVDQKTAAVLSESISDVSHMLKLSLREMERIYASMIVYWSMSDETLKNGVLPVFLAALKVCDIDAFEKIRQGPVSCSELLSRLGVQDQDFGISISEPLHNIALFLCAASPLPDAEIQKMWGGRSDSFEILAKDRVNELREICETNFQARPYDKMKEYCDVLSSFAST